MFLPFVAVAKGNRPPQPISAERIVRLPRREWAYGRANSSIVMAAFLHVAPDGRALQRPRPRLLVRLGRDADG